LQLEGPFEADIHSVNYITQCNVILRIFKHVGM
jgi:hypothetical protein